MKKLICLCCLAAPLLGPCQVGLKAGLNFCNVTNASSINNNSRSGYMFGLFIAPSTKSIIASRTELVYSKQAYSFKSGTKTGNVSLNYLIIPQLMGINITKYVQLQVGVQMAILLNAKADSANSSGNSSPYPAAMNFYNKYDYAFAVGGEIHPLLGLLVGARYNIGLGKLYKNLESGQQPTFSSSDAKNNVVQVFVGWTFGKQQSKKSKSQDQ